MSSTRDTSHPAIAPCVTSDAGWSSTAAFSPARSVKTPLASAGARTTTKTARASRQLVAEARLNHHDYERLTIRLQDYEQTLLPQSRNRITAALAGWRSGRNALREVLDARRAALEIQMARFDLQHDLARHFVQLTYLGAFETDAGEDPHE